VGIVIFLPTPTPPSKSGILRGLSDAVRLFLRRVLIKTACAFDFVDRLAALGNFSDGTMAL